MVFRALRRATGTIAVLAALSSSSASAQQAQQTQQPARAEAPVMLATQHYLFVLRGDVLWQFDIDTMELLHRVVLDGAARPPGLPAGIAEAEPTPQAAVEEPTVEDEEVREPARPAAVRRAIELGLQWLARHQDADGKWDADGFMKHDQGLAPPTDGPGNPVHDVGVTGLATLALLQGGSTLRRGPHRDAVKKAMYWLRNEQGDNGLFGSTVSHDFIYDHAIATWAVVEAYARSDFKLLRGTAQRGIDYLEWHRNPYMVWRYQPRDNDNDSSVTGWCIRAYAAGRDAGLQVNPNAFKLAATWFDSVTDETGLCGYTKRGERSSRHPGNHALRFPVEKGEALTATGLDCRLLLGQDPDMVPVMRAAARRILAHPPVWDPEAGTIDHYYWFAASRALGGMKGREWQPWRRHLVATLTGAQRQDGNFAGSWDPAGVWGEDGGRVYATALLVMALLVE